MAELQPYLHFDGNCEEAMKFYQQCLGGELTMMRISETPMAAQMPVEMHNQIMHSTLRNGNIVFMASDMMGKEGRILGNTMTLCLNCKSEDEINNRFAKISAGGKVTHQLKTEFWGSTYGDCTDKFGIRWMFNYDKPKA